jgi:hypothetical protein
MFSDKRKSPVEHRALGRKPYMLWSIKSGNALGDIWLTEEEEAAFLASLDSEEVFLDDLDASEGSDLRFRDRHNFEGDDWICSRCGLDIQDCRPGRPCRGFKRRLTSSESPDTADITKPASIDPGALQGQDSVKSDTNP